MSSGAGRCEDKAGSCDQELARVTAMCLAEGGEEERLMTSDLVPACLSRAVEAWQEAWQVVEGGGLEVERMFGCPLEMLQHLLLTAVMCAAHSQVSVIIIMCQ